MELFTDKRRRQDYSKLDAAIIRALTRKPGQRVNELHSGAVAEAAYDLSAKELTTPAWRIVDRRLQALRKAGRIEHAQGIGWRIKLSPVRLSEG